MSTTNQQVQLVAQLQKILVDRATSPSSRPFNPEAYLRLRERLVAREGAEIRDRLPSFVRNCRSLEEFWHHIRDNYPTYQSRREYIYREFIPLFDFLEGMSPEEDQPLFANLGALPTWENVGSDWRKAKRRFATDPDGAITSARTLLESVCKHILDDAGVEYKATDSLPNLYHQTAEQLSLAPKQHSDERFKKILGNAQAVIDGLAALRNEHGDAHGKGQKGYRPAVRHAELAVSLSGAISSFLIATWQQRQGQSSPE